MFPINIRQMLLDSLTFSHYELSRGRVLVETQIPDDLPPVAGIKNQLQQVFINLLTNASHACAEKGGGAVTISARDDGGVIEIEVADDGVGIKPEFMERLFDPFFTTKPEGKGTGLGLTIVREIVSRHHGAIGVKSEPGRGAIFTVRLPAWKT
jgi:signal transduction histidine kinase